MPNVVIFYNLNRLSANIQIVFIYFLLELEIKYL